MIVGREEQNLPRLIKESMYIRVNNPSLNRNIGKYLLPHIWDEVLVKQHRTKIEVMTHGFNTCQKGDNICLDNIDKFQPVAIPSATMGITSASTMWLFHLPQQTNLLAVTHVAVPSATLGKNISPFISGNSICHFGNNISKFIMWL